MKKEESMKTGRDANQAGVYSSQCCLAEINVSKDQMFPRCPSRTSLTVWDSKRETSETQDNTPRTPLDRNVDQFIPAGIF
jgi:hypothetical protein